MSKLYKILVLLVLAVAAFADMQAQESSRFALDSAYLCRPFSAMDAAVLARMEKDADTYKDMPGYEAYKTRLGQIANDLTIYSDAVNRLDSPFDFGRIVDVRKSLIPLITTDGYFSEPQQAEMDRLDILLSRYRGSVELFKTIIDRINSDPVVTAYRAAARKGRPSAEERRKYIAAISAVVYKPSTKEFNEQINSYIQLIPYLRPRLTEYLNAIAQYPETTPAVETEIKAVRL